MRRPLLLAALLLAGCGSAPVQEEGLVPALTALLPTPATPGDAVTAYGRFPQGVTLTLDGRALAHTPVDGGMRFTVPHDVRAGSHEVTVSTRPPLTGQLRVKPRIDRAVAQGRELQVSGAGWTEAPEAQLEVNGQPLATRISGRTLVGRLLGEDTYGTLNVRVLMGDEASDSYALQREAAALTGQVRTPVPPAARSTAQALSVGEKSRVLLVAGQPAQVPLSGLQERETVPGLGLLRLTYGDAQQAAYAAEQLRRDPGVTHVEADQPVERDGSRLTAQGQPTPEGRQWFWSRVGLPAAWDRTRGAGTVVAVVDTGVALDHPDLRANLLPGYDFADEDASPQDTDGHGTHVAGLIAADGVVSGAAPQAKVLPVRVLGSGDGSTADLARGLLWAAGLLDGVPNPHPAQIINVSLGIDENSPVLADAVRRVQARGILIVAAAGNDGGRLAYPAALPGVLAVTALAGPKLPYQPAYASRGRGTRLTAYGGDLLTDQDGDGVRDGILSTDLTASGAPGYDLRMGTSMAAPQVSGIAALALASGTAPALLRETLERRAGDLGVMGFDEAFGHGLVSADVARLGTPRTYVVALSEAGQVLAWTPAVDGRYQLHTLPPAQDVRVLALSDHDNDGLLGEAGEFASEVQTLNVPAAQTRPLDFDLAPTDGARALPLRHP